jgi:hypothetical protein
MHRCSRLLAVPLTAALLLGGVGTALPASANTAAAAAVQTKSPSALPFDAPATAVLRASARRAFAHYLPSLPLSLDNAEGSSDYYARNYIDPRGEGGRHAAYGGFLRDRPLTRATRPGDWRLADAEDEVRQAVSAGLDGFAVDLLVAPGSANSRVLEAPKLLLRAAANVDPGFKIMLVPDMTGGLGALDVGPLAAYVAELAASPAAYRLSDGRLVLSPFKAENRSAQWWKTLLAELRTAHGLDIAFLPIFLNEQPHVASFAPFSYGLSNWGSRNPAWNPTDVMHATSPRGRAAAVHAAGAAWMQPVSAQDVRPRAGTFQEAQNTTNLRATWKLAIDSDAELVQLTTWNDYAEGSELAPSAQQGWSYLDLSAYYLTWWKTGRAPKVVRDTVYLTHRTQSSSSKPSFPQTKLMTSAGGSPTRDTVEALTFLTAPGVVTVRVGSKTHTCSVGSGVDTCTVPLGTGTVTASVTRGGATTAAVTSPFTVTSTPVVQNLRYVATTSRTVPAAAPVKATPALSEQSAGAMPRPRTSVNHRRWRQQWLNTRAKLIVADAPFRDAPQLSLSPRHDPVTP